MSGLIDRHYIEKTLAKLVQINSINPLLDRTGAGEAEIAAFIGHDLETLGFKTTILNTAPGRDSVVGVLRGKGGGKSLMLNAHIDTVGVEGMENPFSGEIRDGKLYGRGAFDMKGAMAACMAAGKAIAEKNIQLDGDLVIAGVADEEFTSIGTSDVIRHFPTTAAIVTEPTQLDVCLAHKGFIWLEVETHGVAAHGSKFMDGVDANMHMGRFLAKLDLLEKKLRTSRQHALVGPGSIHAATLHGGTGISTYAANCKLEIERRTIPSETEAQIVAEIQGIIDTLAREDEAFSASLKVTCVRDAFEVDRDAGIVQGVTQASKKVLKNEPNYFGDTPWMDSALLSSAGIETVVIGPGGTGAHAAVEWVDLDSVEKLAKILVESAINYCGEKE